MKYPLTENARDGARQLVQNWDDGKLEQHMVFSSGNAEGDVSFVQLSRQHILKKCGFPLSEVMLELAKFGLIDITFNRASDGKTKSIEILLLQELRNAVENDFEVSDYFLTLNAVGNIIINSSTGPVQGVGYNTGTVNQNIEQLADGLIAQLGMQFVQSNAELRQAIEDLRTATEGNKQSKLGKVISELGRCLGHTANAAAIAGALLKLAPYLY
jgi:hypothetical protein